MTTARRPTWKLELRQQVLLSYLPVLLIPIIVIGLITRTATEYGLTVLVTNEAARRADNLAMRFANYYNLRHSWDGVGVLFSDPVVLQTMQNPNSGRPVGPPNGNPPRGPGGGNNATRVPDPNANSPRSGVQGNGQPILGTPDPEQIILADEKGIVLAANTPESSGRSLSPDTLARGVPIFSEGKTVGVLVIGAALGILDQSQKQLLDSINLAVLLSAILSMLVTLGIGLWLSGQISAPVKSLIRGVRGLARGVWTDPLPVHSQNELGELTQAFNQMAEDLTRQQTLRKQLIADIAHDLRTPLSVMTLEIEGIKAGLQTPEESAQSLQDEVTWLSRLVDDLHTLSLIDAGQLPMQPEPTDPNLFLESVYRHWRTVAEAESRPFTFETPGNLPLVNIDPPRMRQVLGNLINNAIQHTPPTAAIAICASTLGATVQIQIRDTGQGISPEALPHLFERFYRGDKSRKRRRSNGSGLGLSIAHQLTTLQQGELSVRSELGKGTTFTVSIPVFAG